MEDESDEWLTEEDTSQSVKEDNTSRLRWVWDKGVGIGKKVALTGAVISSAPIILPPLLVISALSFAVSLPLGFVYASYAFSEKLMSKLLPNPVNTSEVANADFEGEYDYENVSGVREDRQEEEDEIWAGEEPRDGIYNVMGEDKNEEIVRESTGLLEKIREGDEVDNGVKDDKAVDNKGVFVKNLDDQEPAKGIEEENVEKEANTVDVKEPVQETEKENISDETRGKDETTSNLEKRNINEVVRDQESEKVGEGKKLKLEENNGESKEADLKSEQKKKRRKTKRGKASLDEKKVNEESVEGKKAEYKYNVEGLNAEDKEIAIQDTNNARESTVEKGSDTGDVTGAKGVPDSEKMRQNGKDEDSKTKEIADSLDLPVSEGARQDNTETAPPPNQVAVTEDRLWQQIDALRVIVGYKAALDKALIGEVKALYIFTGVEPPSSFKDPQDLVEVDEKLRFLMSVVGVK